MIKSTNHIRGGQNNNKLKVLAIALSIMVMLLLIVQIQALLTSHDSKDNVFTMGNLTVTLTEPNWDQNAASAAAPNQIIDKDPTVNNTGANDAYVFVRVEVPIESDTELFTLLDSTGAEGINTGWSLLNSGTSGGNKVYTYSYGTEDALTALAPGSSTNPVFSKVKVASLSSYASSTYNLNVTAYAVQTTEVSNVPSEAWELVKGELGVVDPPTVISFNINKAEEGGPDIHTGSYQTDWGTTWEQWFTNNSHVLYPDPIFVTDDSIYFSYRDASGMHYYYLYLDQNMVGGKDAITNGGVYAFRPVQTLEIRINDTGAIEYAIEYVEGMTWREWVESSYNNVGMYVDSNGFVRDLNSKVTRVSAPIDSSWTKVESTDMINNSKAYYVSSSYLYVDTE